MCKVLNELPVVMDSASCSLALSSAAANGGEPPGLGFHIPVSISAAASGGVPLGPAFHIPVSSCAVTSGGVPPCSVFHISVSSHQCPGLQLCLPLLIAAVPPDLPFSTRELKSFL